jgi:hypothetical protein
MINVGGVVGVEGSFSNKRHLIFRETGNLPRLLIWKELKTKIKFKKEPKESNIHIVKSKKRQNKEGQTAQGA